MSSTWNKYFGDPLKKTFVGRTFNSWFGSNVTHIKNESGYEILAVIASQQNSIENFSISSDKTITVKLVQGTNHMKGTIKPGCVFPFERTNSIDYLTIIMKKSKNTVEKTAEDIQINANVSYRVDENGTPWSLKYDSGLD